MPRSVENTQNLESVALGPVGNHIWGDDELARPGNSARSASIRKSTQGGRRAMQSLDRTQRDNGPGLVAEVVLDLIQIG